MTTSIGERGLRSIYEDSADLLLRVSEDGTINYTNLASVKLLGLSTEEIVGKNISDITQDFVIQGERLDEQTVIFKNHQGEDTLLETRWRSFVNDPDIGGIIVRARDASRSRELERERQYTLDLFTAAFRVNNAMCSITDPENGELLDVNEVWVDTLGHSREEAIGKTSLELNIWGPTENRDKAVGKLRSEGRLHHFETDVFAKGGKSLTVSISAEIITIAGIERLFFSSTDVTEERNREAILRESEARFRDIAEYSSDWFWELDQDYRFTFVSQGADLLGDFDHTKYLGMSLPELFTFPEQPPGDRLLEQMLHARQAFKRVRLEFVPSDGDVSYHEFSGKPLFDETGIFIGYRGTGTNTTSEVLAEANRKATEERLQQAQKMEAVGQLTGGVAHDFNNLLTVILGNAEMLTETPENSKQITAIMQAALRGGELTGNLLAFSRAQVLNSLDFRLDEQLQPMLAILPRTLGEFISITSKTQPDLWQCHADPGQVENALLNLAINARDAMPDGGHLEVLYANRTDQAGEYVTMTIRDTGSGMSEEIQDKILEPFFTTKDVGKGTGLGLSMVYGFVEQSGGKLSIQSTPGVGTAIEISLPRATPEEQK